jgi:hypothetical protein
MKQQKSSGAENGGNSAPVEVLGSPSSHTLAGYKKLPVGKMAKQESINQCTQYRLYTCEGCGVTTRKEHWNDACKLCGSKKAKRVAFINTRRNTSVERRFVCTCCKHVWKPKNTEMTRM